MKFLFFILSLFLNAKIGSLIGQTIFKVDTTTYHNITIIDKYRWLENLKDVNVTNWLNQKNAQYDSFLLSKKTEKESIKKVIEKFNIPNEIAFNKMSKHDDSFFYVRKDTLSGNELLIRKSSNKEDTIFYPSDKLHKYTIAQYRVNKNFEKILICYYTDHTECGIIAVIDSKTKQIIDSSVHHVMTLLPISWIPGKNEFVYTRFSEKENGELADRPYLDNSVYKHRVGDAFKGDKILLSRKNNPNLLLTEYDSPSIYFSLQSSIAVAYAQRAGTMLTLFAYNFLNSIEKQMAGWKKIFDTKDSIFSFDINKNEVYLLQRKNRGDSSSVFKLVITPNNKFTEQLILTSSKNISDLFYKKGNLLLLELEGPSSVIENYNLDNRQLKKINLSTIGKIADCPTNSETDFFFKYETWTDLPVYYSYNVTTNLLKRETTTTQKFPYTKDFISEIVYVPSRDGIRIPMTLIHKKNIVLNNTNRVIIEAYGSYGISKLPRYFIDNMAFVELGFIYAIAHTRGGGELGEGWHLAGVREKKYNTSNDVIDCAKYLVDRKFTAKEKIGLFGGSAGGIAVGMAMVKEPALFGALCIRSGSLNVVLAEQTNSTQSAIIERGSVKNKTEFMSIYNNDVYHSINPSINYPPVLVTTGFNDPRVAPWMSAKFFIKLQEANKNLLSYLKVSSEEHSYIDPLEEILFFTENIR
jgi:prolyl oligopeptidase